MTSYFEQRLAEIKANPDLVVKAPKVSKTLRRAAPVHVPDDPATLPASSRRVGWIYFLPFDEVIKIGFTNNRRQRLAELQTGNHRELRYEDSFPATREAERILHEHFAANHVRGEWYEYTWEISELMGDLMDYQGCRCVAGSEAPDRTGKDLLRDMDEKVIDNDDLRVILATIGEPWPEEFRRKIMGPAPSDTKGG